MAVRHGGLWGLLLLSGFAAAGQPDSEPRLEQYASYAAFRHDWESWRAMRQNPPQTEVIHISGYDHPPVSTEVSLPPMRELDATASEMNESLADGYHPPIEIHGPENMDIAVEQAKRFVHPVYKTKLRYNRSHFYSFPLQQATAPVLADAVADTLIPADFRHPRVVSVIADLLGQVDESVMEEFGGRLERSPSLIWTSSPPDVLRMDPPANQLSALAATRGVHIDLILR